MSAISVRSGSFRLASPSPMLLALAKSVCRLMMCRPSIHTATLSNTFQLTSTLLKLTSHQNQKSNRCNQSGLTSFLHYIGTRTPLLVLRIYPLRTACLTR